MIGCSAHACWQLAPVFLNVPDVEEFLCEKHLADLRKRRPALGTHYHALCEQSASMEASAPIREMTASRQEELSSLHLSRSFSLRATGLLTPALS